MGTAVSTFHEYMHHPFRFWDGLKIRQAEKLEKNISRLCSARGWRREDVPDNLLRQAVSRQGMPPVYVTGLGGSGSHWLSLMLAELPGFFAVGEVYFPPALVDAFDSDPGSASIVIDALHLLHARDQVAARDRAVNCAAGSWRTGQYRAWDDGSVVVLLTRDPRDQVLSTTFRKREYRSFVAGDASDADYLTQRCLVSRTDRSRYLALGAEADLVLRYEDLRGAGVRELSRVLQACDLTADPHILTTVVRRHDAGRAKARDRVHRGNLNLEAPPDDWSEQEPKWVAAVHCELPDVIESLGYPFGMCLGRSPTPAEVRPRPSPSPQGVTVRGWTEEGWSAELSHASAWLAEVAEENQDQRGWFEVVSFEAICAARLNKVSGAWLEKVLSMPSLKYLDLGTVTLTPDQGQMVAQMGNELSRLNLWGNDPALVASIRSTLPRAWVVA